MDIERAQRLVREAYELSDFTDLVYELEGWNEDSDDDPEVRPDMSEADASRLLDANMYLSWATIDPGTPFRRLEYDDRERKYVMRDWVEGDYMPSLPMTEALAKARRALVEGIADLPADVLLAAGRCLRLVDEALAALDLTPDSPLVAAAAE